MIIDYEQLYEVMVIDPAKKSQINDIAERINSFRGIYNEIENLLHVPANIIAAIHYRESSLSFKRHLHNGDPLIDRTVHVPKGRPLTGNPPFSWQQSALDAFRMRGWDKVTDWSMPNALAKIEAYNGMGYKKRNIPSPYLWSWSSNYVKGKFIADGKFDSLVVDKQCGAAVILKSLAQQ